MEIIEHVDILAVQQELTTLADRLAAAGYSLVAAHLSTAIDSISSLMEAPANGEESGSSAE